MCHLRLSCLMTSMSRTAENFAGKKDKSNIFLPNTFFSHVLWANFNLLELISTTNPPSYSTTTSMPKGNSKYEFISVIATIDFEFSEAKAPCQTLHYNFADLDGSRLFYLSVEKCFPCTNHSVISQEITFITNFL